MTKKWPSAREEGTAPIQELYALSLEKKDIAFIYLGFAGIILRTKDKTLAFDVGKLCIQNDEIEGLESLDLHFYSHSHFDHWEPEVSMKIFETTGAKIIAEPEIVKEMIGRVSSDKLVSAKPDKPLNVEGYEISAVTGVHGRPITLFRLKGADFSIFHGADSGPVPLKDYPSDVAFLPVGSPSPTCSPEKALEMALDINPKVIVAMHGTKSQLQKFSKIMEKKMPDATVMTPEPLELMKISL
ncbi:MAG: MBL fold metallo-hydrolase [Candidatus Heimdallarchaeota archaeon]